MKNVCRLCLAEAKLCRSHIIPEFAYKPAYDSKHRIRHIYDAAGGKIKWEQKGFREELLCQRCETALSVYEHYASRILRPPLEKWPKDVNKRIHFTGLDYRKLKLFLLSVLWRAGVSKDHFCSRVKLGPHEERLRSMIHGKDPGKSMDYACVLFALQHEGNPLPDVMVEPMPFKILTHNSYLFVFGGFVFVYFVSSHNLPPGFGPRILSKSGEMLVKENELGDFKFLRQMWETVAKHFPSVPGDELRS